MSQLKNLREQRAAAHAKAVEFLKAPQTEETRKSADAALAEVDLLGADIARIERADAIEAEVRKGAEVVAPIVNAPVTKSAEEVAKEYRAAFVAVLRNRETGNIGFGPDNNLGQAGISRVSPKVLETLTRGMNAAKEQRDLAEGAPMLSHIGTYTGLGYFVPTGFVNAIEQATKYFAPLLDGSVITVMDTATGQPLPFPTSNDTSNAATIVGEAGTVNELDATASQISFGAYKFTSGLVKASLELIQDSAFDLEAWLVQRFAERWGRGLESYLTNGSGVSQPTGLLTAIAASGATPIVAAGSSANDGTSATGANSIGYADLVNLEHSVDPTYRRGAKYMFHDQTLSALKKLVDKYGRPLWAPGITAGDPDKINGYAYVINQSMPQIGASNVTVAFGDMKKFIARRVKDLSVMKLVERYAELGQVGFVSFARIDSNLIDAGTHPINVLQQHS
jgi:HK97 family phage major capsid protein